EQVLPREVERRGLRHVAAHDPRAQPLQVARRRPRADEARQLRALLAQAARERLPDEPGGAREVHLASSEAHAAFKHAREHEAGVRGRVLVGIVLLVAGVAWLLDLAGYPIFPGGFSTWWPLLV